ncbi:MAG TPA: DUF624 domain-containing protein [Ruminiclostridium sp.]
MTRGKREFGDGPIYTITNYIFWLLMGSLYFMVLNIPLLLILLIFFAVGNNPLPPYFTTVLFICCVPIGPAVTALLSVMGKLVREKDINITKDFFQAYKTNFKQALFLWIIQLALFQMFIFDAKIFVGYGFSIVFSWLMYAFAFFLFLISLYVFPILSRFSMKSSHIFKLSVYFCIKRFYITFSNICIIVIVGYIFTKYSFIILFAASIIAYMIMYFEKKILAEIEVKVREQGKEAISVE